MSATVTTAVAADLREEALPRTMNAILLNAEQARRGYDPSPEIDSGIETNALARACVLDVLREAELNARDREKLTLALTAIGRTDGHLGTIIELNGREHQQERHAARSIEVSAARLQMPRDGISRKRVDIARRLRPILAVADVEALRAGVDLAGILGRMPESTLRSSSMRNELGKGPHARLCALLDLLDREQVM